MSIGVPGYSPVAGTWDEALLPSGFPRRPWRSLATSLGRMGFRALSERWRTGQQIIQANGITYNIYGDPQGKERQWLMDPIPMILGATEWHGIEQAIRQRATLLNRVVADLYGDQNLIKTGKLPSALLYGNPHYLRPCLGIGVPGDVFLHSYAADIARAPDGSWWVIADRTQAPSGVGYALENRLVGARTLPAAFSRCAVSPLNKFFDMQRRGLTSAAPRAAASRGQGPRIVLLTPGPHNETYFEHSFLARQWGFPLVEGADLIARDNQVFLKTLSGLEPVDVILRRVDDNFCDPLELRADSLLGVPGLLQAVRAGTVAIANALGSGLMETPAHMAFLPSLCRTLLNEDLRMPSVATWWCGQEDARKHVLENLKSVVLKPAFAGPGRNIVFPAMLTDAECGELRKSIEERPGQFVAQEQVELSTAPVRTETGIAARHIVVRVFAAWDGEGYSVLPGGLTRVSTADKSLVVSMQNGGGSKDTWVLADRPENAGPHTEGARPDESASRSPRISIRGAGELPSRAADNLFWLGRYTERVEDAVRLIRSLLPALSFEEDFGRTASLFVVRDLMAGLGYLRETSETRSIAQLRWQLQRLLTGLIYDPSRIAGIGWNLAHVRRVAWPLKERLSQDTWRVLQQLETEFSAVAPSMADQSFVAEIALLDRATITLSAFAGLMMENTTRGFGWRFLEIGRRLERALQTISLLDAVLSSGNLDNDQEDLEASLELLLQIADSSITYHTRHLTDLRVEYVLELLLTDEANPRSVAFQVATMIGHIQHLPARDTDEHLSPEHRLASKALDMLRQAWVADLAKRDSAGRRTSFGELSVLFRAALWDFSEELTGRYLSHLTQSRLAVS